MKRLARSPRVRLQSIDRDKVGRQGVDRALAKFGGVTSGGVPYIAVLQGGKIVTQGTGAPSDTGQFERRIKNLL